MTDTPPTVARAAPSTLVRVAVLLLLALDIGGACWLAFARSPKDAQSPATDPGIAKLVLLSELPQPPSADIGRIKQEQSSTAPAAEQCRTIGPFANEAEANAAMAVLASLTQRVRSREEGGVQPRGVWVYLPAMPSREQALAKARELAAIGVQEYFVVTSGERQNTISLGVFRDPANAERRRAEIAALGFAANVEPRSDDGPVWWVDLALQGGQSVEWKSRLARAAELREETIACF